jgi:hypothetical protein
VTKKQKKIEQMLFATKWQKETQCPKEGA